MSEAVSSEQSNTTNSGSRCFLAIGSSLFCFISIVVIGGLTLQHGAIAWWFLGVGDLIISSVILAAWFPGTNTFIKPTSKMMLIALLTVVALICISWRLHPQQAIIDEYYSFDTFGKVCLIIIVCGISPVFEEIYFRGLMFPIASVKIGALAGGALSAFLFILFHLSLGVVLATVVYTWLVYRSRSIYPSIFAHIAYNSVWFIRAIMTQQ